MRSHPAALRGTPVAGLAATGALTIIVAFAVDAVGFGSASGVNVVTAFLLIAGCDLLVAALVSSTLQISPAVTANDGLMPLLSDAIGTGVMLFALSGATVIAIFGNAKSTERLGYCLAILVLVPLCVTLAWRHRRQGRTGEHRLFVAVASLATTAGALLLARALTTLTSGFGTSLLLLLELLVAGGVIAASSSILPTRWLHRIPASALTAALPLLLAACAMATIPTATISFSGIAIPLAAALAAFLVASAYRGSSLARPAVRSFDLAFIAIASLLVFYAGNVPYEAAENHAYFIGPAFDVLHGHPLLVTTFSQYGVGMIYFLAGVFLVVPLGYGTFTILLSTLTVALFVAVYAVLRWSTRSVLGAAIGLITLAVLDTFGQIGFYAYFPSTGVLRFGLPWAIVFCSLAAVRMPHHRRLFDGLVIVLVGAAAVWSGETALYCLGTAGALACLRAVVSDGDAQERLQLALRQLAVLFVVAAASLLAFTLAMRVSTGVWPDWAGYLEYIYGYTIADFGDLLIEPWSPGLAIGGLYTISLAVIVLLVLLRPELVRERISTFIAATGLTALGILVYTYFLGRSHPNNVIHIAPPAIVLVFVWLDLARSTLSSRTASATVIATAVFFAALVITGEREDLSRKYRGSALAAVLGTGASIGDRLKTLADNPVVEPRAAYVERFIRSLGPKPSSLTLLLSPRAETEVLIRLGIANAVTSSNPVQEALSHQRQARAAAAVNRLRPGGVLVISDGENEDEKPAPIEFHALTLIRARFALRQIHTDGKGLRAFRLLARS
jgi:hypothetical protein